MAKEKKAPIVLVREFIQKYYDIRYNTISNRFDYKEKDTKEWEDLNEDEILIKLLENHYRISATNLIALLKSNFVKKYNPFIEYFESLPKWDGTNYIGQLSEYIKMSDHNDLKRFNTQFQKMFVRTIASSLERNLNKQAFVLVHRKQNSGKSTFLRWLCPPDLKDYYTEEIGLDKDSLIALAENFIINLDELSTLSKKDINELKSVMSKDAIKVRLPYNKRSSILKRRNSFVASTNNDEFLSDETGNVRWVCFTISKINWDYKKDFDINKVWAQAYALFQNGEEYELTADEIKENELANHSFMIRTPEMELIQSFFTPADKNDIGAEFMTSTDILKFINEKTFNLIRLFSNRIGKALITLGYEKVSVYNDIRKFSVKGYWVKSNEEPMNIPGTEESGNSKSQSGN